MSRLPEPDLARLPREAASALAEFPVRVDALRMTAHAATLVRPLVDLVTAMLTRLELAPRYREALILLVSHETDCAYEWTQHVPQAHTAGVRPEDLACVTDASRTSPDARLRVLLEAGRRYLGGRAWTDATVDALQEAR